MQDAVICRTNAELRCFCLVSFAEDFFFCPLDSPDVRLASCLDSLQKALAEETKQDTQFKKEKTTC